MHCYYYTNFYSWPTGQASKAAMAFLSGIVSSHELGLYNLWLLQSAKLAKFKSKSGRSGKTFVCMQAYAKVKNWFFGKLGEVFVQLYSILFGKVLWININIMFKKK